MARKTTTAGIVPPPSIEDNNMDDLTSMFDAPSTEESPEFSGTPEPTPEPVKPPTHVAKPAPVVRPPAAAEAPQAPHSRIMEISALDPQGGVRAGAAYRAGHHVEKVRNAAGDIVYRITEKA